MAAKAAKATAKKSDISDTTELEKPFSTAFGGFKKSEVNLYINKLKKRIITLEEMLKKAYADVEQAKYNSNSDYETQILDLREQLRLERSKNNVEIIEKEIPETLPETQLNLPAASDGMPAISSDSTDEFKDMLL